LSLSFGDSNNTTLTESLYLGANSPDNANVVVGNFSAPSASAWRKLRIDLTIDHVMNPVRIYVDGTIAMSGGLTIGTADVAFDTVRIGVPYTQTTTGGTIRFDDVACTFR